MADLTVTAANVVKGADAVTTSGVAGETITAGKSVYKKAADGKWWMAQADGTVEEAGSAVEFGIALHASLANQPIVVQTAGSLNIGATTAKTTAYMISAAAGGICPQADLVSTNKITYLGYATDAVGTFVLHKKYTGAVV